MEELLHPLSRVHDLQHGRLVLTLQTLRFFDVIFWPHPDSSLRNVDMLRFVKESAVSNDGPRPPQMTIFSAALRMSFYTLTHLSPVTHLAVLNVKRLRAMIMGLDRMPPQTTPTLDWLLATVTHVTLNLQRIIVAIGPVFEMIELDVCGAACTIFEPVS